MSPILPSLRRPLFVLVGLLLIKAVAMGVVLLSSGLHLDPDEAQYWTWSQHLDWGYYSKPPGIAWQIFLTTWLFGSTEFGVRFSALLLGFFLPLAVYRLARACGQGEKTAFWSGVTMALTPLGFLASLLATTDGGMALFLTLACAEMAQALTLGVTPNYLRVGAWVAAGALFKWPIYLLWVIVGLVSLFVPRLRSKRLLGGMVLSLLGLLPSLYWNLSHGWVTFRHVSGNMSVDYVVQGTKGNFFSFLGMQTLWLTPPLFLLLLYAWWVLFYRRREGRFALGFCGWVCFLPLACYVLLSLFKKMQGNWCVFVYPPAIVVLCAILSESRRGLAWIKASLLASSCFMMTFLFLPRFQEKASCPEWWPYRLSPFRQQMGWDKLAKALEEAGYDPDTHFLCSDRYQTSSLLSFYAPGQHRAYFLNVGGSRHNQFCFWPSLAQERPGKTGYFVYVEESDKRKKHTLPYAERLAPYFTAVQDCGSWDLFVAFGKPAKRVHIFKCINYNGLQPKERELY